MESKIDRIGKYLDGLKVQKSRHELSKTHAVLRSHWDPNKYPPVLATDPNFDGKVSATTSPMLQAIAPLENETTRSRPESSWSALSRESSIGYSSCFSSAGRSVSAASSLSSAKICHSSAQRRDVSSAGTRPFSLLTHSQEPLYEDLIERGERRMLVKTTNGRIAFLEHERLKREKGQWVEYDLAKERRQMRREEAEKRKLRLRAGKEARSLEKQSQSCSTLSQATPDVQHTPVVESGEKTTTRRDTTGSSQVNSKGCEFSLYPHSETGHLVRHRIEYGSATTHSEMGSQTSSASSEDDTDWEDDSDMEGSSEILQFQLPSPQDRNPRIELPPFQTNSSPMKSRLIDKLMLDFCAIFDSNWPHGMRQHGSPGQSTSSITASESGATSRDSSSVRYGKRSRSYDGEDEEGDDHHERRKRTPIDKLPAVQEDNPLVRNFACPFRKHDPRKYSIQESPRCALKPQKTIARLKAHLYQYHLIEQCPRCKSVFESEATLEAHNMGQERCEAKTDEQINGMTRKMKDQIQCRRKPHPGQTDAEKWEQIYKILFPNETVPDPYFEPVPDHDIPRPQSPSSVNLAHYEAYLRRVLPGFVRNALEAAVNNELQPIEAQLQRRMMEIIQEAQNQAFTSFRDTYRSESGARSHAGLQLNMASSVDDQPYTSIETFFQPPSLVNPISFSNLSDLSISQQNTGTNEFSDSGYASRHSLSTASQHDSSDIFQCNTTPSSSNYNQAQMNSDITMDSSTFDVTQLLNFDGTDDATASSWLDMPPSLPKLDHGGPLSLDSPNG